MEGTTYPTSGRSIDEHMLSEAFIETLGTVLTCCSDVMIHINSITFRTYILSCRVNSPNEEYNIYIQSNNDIFFFKGQNYDITGTSANLSQARLLLWEHIIAMHACVH